MNVLDTMEAAESLHLSLKAAVAQEQLLLAVKTEPLV